MKELDIELRKYTNKVTSAQLKLTMKEKKESILKLKSQLEKLKEAGANMDVQQLENSVKT